MARLLRLTAKNLGNKPTNERSASEKRAREANNDSFPLDNVFPE